MEKAEKQDHVRRALSTVDSNYADFHRDSDPFVDYILAYSGIEAYEDLRRDFEAIRAR